jgi:hypothetical protein
MELQISSPCPMRWESLTGDDRVRYCGRCKLNVYNLAEMGKDEVENIFRTSKGRVCGRIYLRGDRTATLRDCPQGRADKLRRRLLKAFAGVCVVVFALVCRSVARPDLRAFPRWVQEIAAWISPEEPQQGGGMTVGRICPLPAPTPTVGP